jgi:hypothetical protein
MVLFTKINIENEKQFLSKNRGTAPSQVNMDKKKRSKNVDDHQRLSSTRSQSMYFIVTNQNQLVEAE